MLSKQKKKLYAASIELVAKYGYDTVTIDDIAQYVGCSKGAFYTHFQSKDAVFVEMFQHIDKKYFEAFQNASEHMTASDRLSLLMDTMVNYCENTCGLYVMRIVYINQISKTPHINHLTENTRLFYKIIRDTVEIGIQRKEFNSNLDTEEMVEYIASFARSAIFDWCLYGGSISLADLSKKRLHFLLRALSMN